MHFLILQREGVTFTDGRGTRVMLNDELAEEFENEQTLSVAISRQPVDTGPELVQDMG